MLLNGGGLDGVRSWDGFFCHHVTGPDGGYTDEEIGRVSCPKGGARVLRAPLGGDIEGAV